jgi:SpoVK/Ycf46/Vps4 family AAA+-type ATPase
VATEIRSLVEANRKKREFSHQPIQKTNRVVSIAKPRGELQNLLISSEPSLSLKNLTLSSEIRSRLERIISQQRRRDLLRTFSKVPSSRILLVGPPGSGKTMTASAIAGELHIPLNVIRFDALITRFMGETAAKLRLIFDQLSIARGVYLFDEFDAVGAKRTSDNDVAEMRRVLNSFLQFMEEPNSSDSIIIAATNHPQLLDDALTRRFDDIIRYDLPDVAMIVHVLQDRLRAFDTCEIDWNSISEEGLNLSQAELVRAADEVIKESLIHGTRLIEQRSIRAALRHRKDVAGMLD